MNVKWIVYIHFHRFGSLSTKTSVSVCLSWDKTNAPSKKSHCWTVFGFMHLMKFDPYEWNEYYISIFSRISDFLSKLTLSWSVWSSSFSESLNFPTSELNLFFDFTFKPNEWVIFRKDCSTSLRTFSDIASVFFLTNSFCKNVYFETDVSNSLLFKFPNDYSLCCTKHLIRSGELWIQS